jgi:hypothetical protein
VGFPQPHSIADEVGIRRALDHHTRFQAIRHKTIESGAFAEKVVFWALCRGAIGVEIYTFLDRTDTIQY